MKKELIELVGKEASVNHSPTSRAKLVEVYDTNCLWEVTANHYGENGNDMIGARFLLPLSWSLNCFYGA